MTTSTERMVLEIGPELERQGLPWDMWEAIDELMERFEWSAAFAADVYANFLHLHQLNAGLTAIAERVRQADARNRSRRIHEAYHRRYLARRRRRR